MEIKDYCPDSRWQSKSNASRLISLRIHQLFHFWFLTFTQLVEHVLVYPRMYNSYSKRENTPVKPPPDLAGGLTSKKDEL